MSKPTFLYKPGMIETLYGGTRFWIESESFQLAFDAAQALPGDQAVLYINTIFFAMRSEESANEIRKGMRSERRGRKILEATFETNDILAKEELLRSLIEERQVKVLILNCLELAVFEGRHKRKLLSLLMKLRNEFGLHIIVYTAELISARHAVKTFFEVSDRRCEAGDYYSSVGSGCLLEELISETLIVEGLGAPFQHLLESPPDNELLKNIDLQPQFVSTRTRAA